MRPVAIVATYNEERFIGGCIEHLVGEGMSVYVIENGSTDATRSICEQWLDRGVIAIEDFPRSGVYAWRPLLERKAEVAASLSPAGGDWFMHVDADEIRTAPPGWGTLADAFTRVEHDGANAVNFLEFTFVPTQESPWHDHGDFRRTMRWYYPFLPRDPDRLTAWKQPPGGKPVDLATSGGHRVDFPAMIMHPVPFVMRHYLFLSVDHAVEKYVRREYSAAEVEGGWHRARATLRESQIVLPPSALLREVGEDNALDPSSPRTKHFLFEHRSSTR